MSVLLSPVRCSPPSTQVDPLLGTDTVEYIRRYRGTPDMLDASLERIRSTALRLAAELATIGFNAEQGPNSA